MYTVICEKLVEPPVNLVQIRKLKHESDPQFIIENVPQKKRKSCFTFPSAGVLVVTIAKVIEAGQGCNPGHPNSTSCRLIFNRTL